MAKLLDFKPKDNINEDLRSMVVEDNWWSMTPDLPRLRFKGPQWVFLWDHQKESEFFDKRGLKKNKDYIITHWSAMTKRRFVPFRNLNTTQTTFKHYLPMAANWMDQIKDNESVHCRFTIQSSEPVMVSGRLVSCSLQALRQLDAFYGNGYTHSRTVQPVYLSRANDAKLVKAWVYFTNMKSICKFDPHAGKYIMSSSVDPSPIPSTNYMGENKKFVEVPTWHMNK